jgi:CAAX protease family protein
MGDPIPPTPPEESSALQPPPPTPAAAPSTLRVIFIGPHGIRAGWRLLLFVLIAVLFGVILATPLFLFRSRVPAGGSAGPLSLTLAEGLPFLALLLAARVMAGIEGRSLADYALPAGGAFGIRFWQGALSGFVAVTALLVAIRAAHGFSFGTFALAGDGLVRYAALWAVGFLALGFLEEFMMRGYALYTLTTGIGFWPSAVLLSALFGAFHLHNPGENWAGALAAGFIGLFFCFTVRRTGDLWFAIGLHASWDYAESFIYSVPDSGVMMPGHLLNSSFHGPRWLTGGTVGPEGSALVFVLIAALFVVFDRFYREVRFPVVRKPNLGDQQLTISGQQTAAADFPPAGS